MAGAQTPGGSDTSATGELLGNGQGAGVSARFDQPRPGAGGSGGGGGGGGADNSGITCRLAFADGSNVSSSLTDDRLLAGYNQQLAAGRDSVAVTTICSDENGNIVSAETVPWAPGVETQVDPAALAAMAREWLTFPTPAGEMTPPIAQGTVAQLPTFVRVDNWQDVSRTATAGPVSATVTAHPVRQRWTIGGRQVAVCHGPGVAVEEGEAPPADACGWTPDHSSAGQRSRRPDSGEPCFNVTVTVTWEVSWTSNVVDGVQELPAGSRQSTACVVVAEVQAVVSDGD